MQASGVHLVLDRAPFDDESLTGLLIRIAGVNLLQSVGSLERLADIAVPRLALEDGGLDELARLSGLRVDVLRSRQYRRSGSGILRLFFGHEIHPFRLQTTAFRYCPVCMGHMGYHKAIWELDLIQACPAHREPLITTDPETGRTLTWRRKDLLEASVGDLPTADGYQDFPSDKDEELRGQELIYDFLGVGNYGRGKILDALDEDLTLDELFKLILFLGGEFNEVGVVTGTKRARCDGPTMLSVTAVGYDLLCDWPNTFQKRLESIKRNYSGTRLGLSQVFDSMFRRMTKMEDGKAKRTLQKAITEFLSEQPIPFNPKSVHFVRGNENVERRYVTLQEATKILGVTQYRARRIAISEGWIDPQKTDRHTQNMIPKDLVLDYEMPPERYYTKTEMFKALGITRSAFPSIRKSGLVTPVFDASDGRVTYVFAKEEVDSLLKRLVASAAVVSEQVGADNDFNLQGLLPRFGQPSVSIGRILTLILAGVVQVDRYNPKQPGIYGLRFLEQNVPEIRSRVRKYGSYAVSGKTVRRRICLDLQVLERGIRDGRVRVIESGFDLESSLIHLGDLLTFLEDQG